MAAGRETGAGALALTWGAGPRAVEAHLLAAIDELLPRDLLDLDLLARPVRVVVPSASLRAHVLGRVALCRGAVAGLEVVTLQTLARQVVSAGGPLPRDARHVQLALAREALRGEPSLALLLGELVGGLDVGAGTLRDLLDAGVTRGVAAAAEAALSGLRPRLPQADQERALALVRAAETMALHLSALGLARRSDLLARAATLLQQRPELAPPATAVLVHGFSDATGHALRLLAILSKWPRARVFLDRPPDPARPEEIDGGAAFVERFAARLAQAAGGASASGSEVQVDAVRVAAPRVALLETSGQEAAARLAAAWARSAVRDGARPEGVGIVARRLDDRGPALARHLAALGVPFSAAGQAAGREGAGHAALAALDVLRRGGEAPVQRWLDARPSPLLARADARLAMEALGVRSLRDLAALELATALGGDAEIELQVRTGLRAVAKTGDQASTEGGWLPRRRVSAQVLAASIEAAREALDLIPPRGERAPFGRHAAVMRRVLLGPLRFDQGQVATTEALARLAAEEREIPAELELTFADAVDVVASAWEPLGARGLGGAGAGVQVLDVTSARGRTFDRLLVLGLRQGEFPRAVGEDPLLPDRSRRALRSVLPALAEKLHGRDEERHLFAQLLAAAPDVTLLVEAADEGGRVVQGSPFVARLRCERPALVTTRVADPASPFFLEAGTLIGERTAGEHAILAGLAGVRPGPGTALAEALAAAVPAVSRVLELPPRDVVAARLAIMAEWDPDLGSRAGQVARRRLSPWHGVVGGIHLAEDPRRAEPFVTTLESVAACGWRAFLQRVLKLGERPAATSGLPALRASLTGALVHAVLDRVVRAALPAATPIHLADLASREQVAVPWPEPAVLERWLSEESLRLIRDEAIPFEAFASLLASLARPCLAEARRLEWAEGSLAVLGGDTEGRTSAWTASGESRGIHFRADRVDRRDGGLVLVDYKTGKPFSDKKRETTRRKHLLQALRQGAWLQAALYARAGSTGRLVFLGEGVPDAARIASLENDDAEAGAAADGALARVLTAFEEGAFLPVVIDRQSEREPRACAECPVGLACVRGDSGARTRLVSFLAAAEEDAEGLLPVEKALARLWTLGQAGSDGPDAAEDSA